MINNASGKHALVGRVDLHAHSKASDGMYTPSEVVNRAARNGVRMLSLTDHDTLAGLEEAAQAAKQQGMTFIPGVELSTEGKKQVHILAYGVHTHMQGLVQLIEHMRADRSRRQSLFLQKMADLGLPVAEHELQLPPGTAFSRPMLAQAMVRKGYVESVGEAFERYLSPGKPAYVSRLYIAAEEVIKLICEDGAVPVLAHPGLVCYDAGEMPERLHEWVSAGLKGVEVHHPSHTDKQREHWRQVAKQHQLLVTAGSDFHGKVDDKHGDIGSEFDRWESHEEDMQGLMAIMNNRG